MQIRPENLGFLREITCKVLQSCQMTARINLGGHPTDFTLHLPCGDLKYPSFWIRDAAMMAESGLLAAAEIKGWLDLIAGAGQNGPATLQLQNGLQVPPWSIADHINGDGKPVYFPGTYCSGEDQGDGSFGDYPPFDNGYYFIRIAHIYYTLQKRTAFLDQKYGNLTLVEKLDKAFAVPRVNELSQLCESYPGKHAVDWGFCDQIKKSGFLLFPSLLRYQAASDLADLYAAIHREMKAEVYLDIASQIKKSLLNLCLDPSGWFLSASGTGRQKDVWGTAFAVWLGITAGSAARNTLAALAEAFKSGTAVNHGYVRGILTGDDQRADSAWENTFCPYQTYQNGGYWATPTGWYLYALTKYDAALAETMFDRFITHTRANENIGAPFEWRSADDARTDGKMYGASAALTYAAIKRILIEAGISGPF